ncbi:MAG: hypothetical protein ABIS47_02075 [Acidimicrobiales bacterium]
MEVLAGARDESHLRDLRDLRGLLARASLIPTEATDFDEAAGLYRACRLARHTALRIEAP